LLFNNNIIHKLGKAQCEVFTQGLLARDGGQKVIKDWIGEDFKDLEIKEDPDFVKLFKADGKFTEVGSPNERYIKGYKDIVDRHFMSKPDGPKTKIIVIHGHSDGLNPYLDTFDQKEMINRVWYCCTVAVDLTKNGDTFTVEEANILPKKPMVSAAQRKAEILDSSPESLEKLRQNLLKNEIISKKESLMFMEETIFKKSPYIAGS
jgi:hypothetical protein